MRGVGCVNMYLYTVPENPLPSPCGAWVAFSPPSKGGGAEGAVTVPLRGVGCVEKYYVQVTAPGLLPSPCGAWVASQSSYLVGGANSYRPLAGRGLRYVKPNKAARELRYRPLAGRGLRSTLTAYILRNAAVTVPLRGVGCVGEYLRSYLIFSTLPSPCGAWVAFLSGSTSNPPVLTLPSPCGAWVALADDSPFQSRVGVTVPLRGVGCVFTERGRTEESKRCYRPLAGRGLRSIFFFRDERGRPLPSPCGA